MLKNLTDIVRWSHLALAEILKPGDLAVDLTVGNGKDTLFLWDTVGPDGCVVGFDIQMAALENAAALLGKAGAEVTLHEDAPLPDLQERGVHLVLADHARWSDCVSSSPKAIIANLGYLPGSDKSVVTRTPTTVAALTAALERLSPGGRLAVVCYVGHTGGRKEAEAVVKLFSEQSEGQFRILRIGNFLAENSPFLVVVEKLIAD